MDDILFQSVVELKSESDGGLKFQEKQLESSPLPLSQAQLGIWVGQLLDSKSNSYWTAQMFELTGEWNESLFLESVRCVIAQTEALHMRFTLDASGLPCQLPTRAHFDEWGELRIDVVECVSHEGHVQPEQAARQWMLDDLASCPADLSGALFRTAIVTLSPERHLWYLCSHHIALDGYAYGLLARQVAQQYAHLLNISHPLNVTMPSLREVIEEDSRYAQSREFERDRQFWFSYLSDLHQVPDAGALCAKQAVSSACHSAVRQIKAQDWFAWQEAAQSEGVDWTTWLAAVWGALQLQTSAVNQVRIGFPVMGRLGSVSLTVPCMHMNIVPIVLRAHYLKCPQTWLVHVSQQLGSVKRHQRYRYEKLKEDLNIQASSRLFSSVLNIMPFDRPSMWGHLTVKTHTLAAGPVEDLAFNVIPNEQGLSIELQSNPAAYSVQQTEQLIDAWIHALHGFYRLHQMGFTNHKGGACERTQQFCEWLDGLSLNGFTTAMLEPSQIKSKQKAVALSYSSSDKLTVPHADVMQSLIAQATLRPQHTALMDMCGNELSYSILLHQVQRLAVLLKKNGVIQGSKVMLIAPRQTSTIVAIYALLWLGACYIPLDPTTPKLRFLQIIEDAQVDVILTDSQVALDVPHDVPVFYLDLLSAESASVVDCAEQCLPIMLESETSLAYMIYTSGSTGKPNGVMVAHSALAYFVHAANHYYQVTHRDRVLQFAPLHFDASIEEIFISLSMGATLVLRNEQVVGSMDGLLSACIDYEISVLDLPTAFWHEWVYGLKSIDLEGSQLRLVILGGEAVLAQHLKRWHHCTQGKIQLFNSYGPTETTVICTLADLSMPIHGGLSENDAHVIPIGKPLMGLTAVVVDEQLRAVAHHEVGELCISGPTVAMGYWQREEVSARRFVDLNIEMHHQGNMRAYRTGDRVRMDDDGVLYYMGRLDDEFKISGYRIDVNEIENALLTHPNVKEAVVLGYTSAVGIKQLVAFYVLSSDDAVDAGRMSECHQIFTQHLSSLLPNYAVPTVFNGLMNLPRNANNKVDRKELRQQLDAYFLNMKPTQVAHSRLESIQNTVLLIWQEVLGQVISDLDQNFFSLGGKSLQAIQVANRLRSALQQDISMAVLFRLPTVRQLASALDESSGHQPPQGEGRLDPFAPLLALQPEGRKHLFCIHPTEGLSWCYMGLSAHLSDCALYGLQSPFMDVSSSLTHIASIVDYLDIYADAIRRVQPAGPYHLIGWSSGGGLAHALAVKLQKSGDEVALLAMMDAYPSDVWEGLPEPSLREAWEALLDVTGDTAYNHDGDRLSLEEVKHRVRDRSGPFAQLNDEQSEHLGYVAWQHMLAYRQLKPEPYLGDVLYFRATQVTTAYTHSFERWQPYVIGEIHCVNVDSTHSGMCRPLPLAHIGQVLSQHMK
ncbi:Dimodular nonribosomal peptide synthase [Ephemeroptericola cinctiostellae]|uniref:Dimodular nonribosomal peptide synthase n=1 Tax=Ephemeroptericola cinctiostellae TaxID=2268024 RepID=A0A345DB62_9BURK|nr:non-ribosomal peptide synthetase [Ephemeroptericola cinctiostellae]AXF85600.1 Dimodular nonribosomal peptide synthase [Ephemeroptericola cinctiostellae]